jgi:signal transduction histidine kinase
VTITLDMGQDVITTAVEDNGQGFNTNAVFDSNESAHSEDKSLGLKTLRERLELVGGSMEVDSEEGRGTKIMMRIPAGQPPH